MNSTEGRTPPVPSPRPAEEIRAGVLRAAADFLRSTHWDGNGCGTTGTSGCSRCYGPSPATAEEVAEGVLDVALPIVLADHRAEVERLSAELADARAQLAAAHTRLGEVKNEAFLEGGRAESEKRRAEAAERALEAVRALFNGGPDTSCRTVWEDGIECVSVPLTDLRAALSAASPTTSDDELSEDAQPIITELRELWQRALEREGNLASAVADVAWKATQFGETEDGDTFAYLVPKGAMHRLVGVAQSNGAHVPVAFRASPEPTTSDDVWEPCEHGVTHGGHDVAEDTEWGVNHHWCPGGKPLRPTASDEEPGTKPAAVLLREIADRDPEAHGQALARGYGVDRDPAYYPPTVGPDDPEGAN